jgi:hypothetical protein
LDERARGLGRILYLLEYFLLANDWHWISDQISKQKMRQLFRKIPLWYTLLSAMGVLSFLLFLAYHDEGYNNWSWMKDAGSWLFMLIAFNVLFWLLIGIGFLFKAALRT